MLYKKEIQMLLSLIPETLRPNFKIEVGRGFYPNKDVFSIDGFKKNHFWRFYPTTQKGFEKAYKELKFELNENY